MDIIWVNYTGGVAKTAPSKPKTADARTFTDRAHFCTGHFHPFLKILGEATCDPMAAASARANW
jgi:hypothetical protein